MRSTNFIHTLLLQAFLIPLAACDKVQQQPLTSLPRLRNATRSDTPSIAAVVNAAFAPIDNWRYIYQFAKEHPADHQRCAEREVSLIWDHDNMHIQVIEAPAESNLTVAAVAIWAWVDSQHPLVTSRFMSSKTQVSSTITANTDFEGGKCTHKDLNITRALDWEPKFNALIETHIVEYFAPKQLYLNTLVTHPDYQLHGAGTRLVSVGIEMGRKEGVNVTLIAQPTAEGFYLSRGFREVRNVSVGSVDGDREFGFNVMAYDFGGIDFKMNG